MVFSYDPHNGIEYARAYALYDLVPEEQRLFYYDSGNDCANFASQCVWAAYGGWISGKDLKNVELNRIRMKSHIRMAPYIWYGSDSFSGSNKWCRVLEYYNYTVSTKSSGPQAQKIAEGDWSGISPPIIKEGDLLQLVVQSYIPDQYGHSLYVSQAGRTWDDILVCCHSFNRLDEPLSSFAGSPEEYPRFRALRFKKSEFYR